MPFPHSLRAWVRNFRLPFFTLVALACGLAAAPEVSKRRSQVVARRLWGPSRRELIVGTTTLGVFAGLPGIANALTRNMALLSSSVWGSPFNSAAAANFNTRKYWLPQIATASIAAATNSQLKPRVATEAEFFANFTAASTTTRTYFDATSTLKADLSANQPRFSKDPATGTMRFLREDSSTNSIKNNTMVGAIVGTPGTLPTNWQKYAPSGFNWAVAGTGTENGINYVDLRLYGTSAAGTVANISFTGQTEIATANAQAWTLGTYFRVLPAGTGMTNVKSLLQFANNYNSSSGYVNTSGGVAFVPSAATLFTGRQSDPFTLSGASIAYSVPGFQITVSGLNVAVDITVRVGMPQFEQLAFSTSIIPTSNAAATRATEAFQLPDAFNALLQRSQGIVAAKGRREQTVAGPLVGDGSRYYLYADTGNSNFKLSDGTNINTVGQQIIPSVSFDIASGWAANSVKMASSRTLGSAGSFLPAAFSAASLNGNGYYDVICFVPSSSDVQLQTITANPDTIPIADLVQFTQGNYGVFMNPFGKGSLVSGVDFTETGSIVLPLFQNNVGFTWSWPNTVNTTVYSLMQVFFGDYNHYALPQTGITAKQINAITTLSATHSLTYSGAGAFNIIYDVMLTATANSPTPLFEIEVFLYPSSAAISYVQGATQIGTTTISGVLWTVAIDNTATPKDILFLPPSPVVAATLDLKAMFAYLVAQGTITGNEYYNGHALGAEPIQGAGACTLQSYSVAYS